MNILILMTDSILAYLSHKLAMQLENDGHIIKHLRSLCCVDACIALLKTNDNIATC
jgi:hypothetical protein